MSRATVPVKTESTSVIRGGGRAFTILLFGGAVQPLVGAALPALGYVWLLIVALLAFGVAGRTASAGGEGAAARGATAALLGYSLVLPVVVMAGAFDLLQVAITTSIAVVVGSTAAVLSSRGDA